MSDIDDRLREIPLDHDEECEVIHRLSKADIAQIKQAFADAGYVTVDKRRYRDEYGREYMQYTFPNEFFRVPQFEFKSGQDWYERFEKECADIRWTGFNPHQVKWLDVLEAAKKASNL